MGAVITQRATHYEGVLVRWSPVQSLHLSPPCTTQYGVELQPELQPCAPSGAAAGCPADFDEVSRAPGLGLGDQGQDPGLGVRLLLARCRIPVRDQLPDLLAPEGALLVRRGTSAGAGCRGVCEAGPGCSGREVPGRAPYTPEGFMNARGGHPEDDYMSLPVLSRESVARPPLLTRAAVIVAKGKMVHMEGGVRRFSRACALAQACRCEVRT
jgi:hypothetical protein